MGQTLSEPVVEKTSDSGQDDRVIFGVSAMQGWRISMEDAHAAVLDLQPLQPGSEQTPAASDVRISFFGVYDGHGGDKVAKYAGNNLHNIIAKQPAFQKREFEQALKDGFLAIDRAILSDPKYEDEVSGCTASVGIVTNTHIYVGNAGDSRTVLGIKGRAKPLSLDHKPQSEAERARICAAGGYVEFGRVNGNLALSRAIGDFEFKKSADLPPEQQIVTVFPDVTQHELSDDDEFLVIACDGIWDCQSSQAVVEFVRRGIAAKQELQAICENMMDNCLASNSDTGGVGCDNMTMIIIGLLNGKTKDEWYKMVADRVADGDGPCAPPEYAEFRGPGVHHRSDNSEDYSADMEQRTRVFGSLLGGLGGRVILLGDGSSSESSNVHDDDGDVDMEDHNITEELEDKDLDAQVKKGQENNGTVDGNARKNSEESTETSNGSVKQLPQAVRPSSPLSSTKPDSSTTTGEAKAQLQNSKPSA
ncbi:PP2C-domain-containing protein [Piedraia hortae CBS 480.64]|uniref:Protein phosphatase 2C homolog 2 n=1 Tax=Piedraia hortae CBS 480.64 TaxID=1314780 RepID=A0A6A7C9C1_9PEZI|nr:PP2C-domain-containing protein [Piedraia hortae CBS 480.64]